MQPIDLLQHTEFMIRMARSFIRDSHLAEDLVQQSILDQWGKTDLQVNHPLPWLKGMLRNRARTHIRGETRRRTREHKVSLPEAQSPTNELVEKAEICRIVADSVARLDELYRQPLMLRFFEGLSDQEAAESLGVPLETLRTRAKRGLKKIRDHLENRYNGETKRWVMALLPIAGLALASEATAAVPGAGPTRGQWTSSPFFKAAALILLAGLILLITTQVLMEEPLAESATPLDPGPVELARLEKPVEIRTSGSSLDRDNLSRLNPTIRTIMVQGRTLSRDQVIPVPEAQVMPYLLSHDNASTRLEAVETGPEGRFTIILSKEQCETAQSLLMQTTAPGFRAASFRLPLLCEDNRVEMGDLLMDRDWEHLITVVDSEKQPIPGAKAAFYKWNVLVPLFECTTNSRGQIRVTEEALERRLQAVNKVALTVSAPGKSDYLIWGIWGAKTKREMPEKVVLEDAKHWVGTVVDARTGATLTGAEVFIECQKHPIKHYVPGIIHPLMSKTERYHTVTNRFGEFILPQLEVVETPLVVSVRAPGYNKKCTPITQDLGRIALEKPDNPVACQALVNGLNQPLPHFSIQTSLGYLDRTDERGYMSIPADFNQLSPENRFILASPPDHPEEKWIYRQSALPTPDGDAPAVLRFEKIIGEKHPFRLLDQLGQPIMGARIELEFSPPIAGFTNQNGEVVLGHWFTRQETCQVKINHTAFMPIRDVVRLPCLAGDPQPEYAMRYGYLFQSLHLKNEEGVAVQSTLMGIKIIPEEGDPFNGTYKTNASGRMDICLPRDSFAYGIVYFIRDPDVQAVFDLERLLSGQPIQLVRQESGSVARTIQGTVADPSGNRLAGVDLVLNGINDGLPWRKSEETAADGSFCFTVPSDGLYDLAILPFLHDEVWHCTEKRKALQHSETLDLTVTPTRSSLVHFHGLPFHQCFHARTYEAWLETPDGRKVKQPSIMKSANRIAYFFGMPDGRYRAFIETPSGDRYSSSLFEVQGMTPAEAEIRPSRE